MDNLMLRSRDREIEYQGNLGYIEKQNGKDVITEHTNPEPAPSTRNAGTVSSTSFLWLLP